MTKQAVYELVRLGSHYEKYIFKFFKVRSEGISKNYRIMKNSPKMNDSEVDLVAWKTPDENNIFFVEKP